MPSWLKQRLKQAGLIDSYRVLIGSLVAVAASFAIVQDLVGVVWLSVAVSLGILGLLLEALMAKARARSKRIEAEWPSVIESLESAALAGMSLIESLRDLAESTQLSVAADFAKLCDDCDSGLSLDEGLRQLADRFALASADLTIETLRLVNDSGGNGFQAALQLQAKNIRERSRLLEQVRAKQGWVVGTAKIAVAAPWIIVTLLAFRPENAVVYNSTTGQFLLALGLLASFVAIRLVTVIGRIEFSKRVFQ